MAMRWAARAGWLLSATAALALVMPAAFAADLRTGPWGGSYDCAQGSTPAFLTLDRIEPSDAQSRVFATFKFGGGALPSGSYTLQGSYDPRTRELALKPVAWVSRPGNYVAVGFNGAINEELTRFSGKMDFHLCGAIRLMSLTRHPTASPSGTAGAATVPSSPATPSPTSPAPSVAVAASPSASAMSWAPQFDARNPPSVDQFMRLTEDEKSVYRKSIVGVPFEAYMALPFSTKMQIATIARADAQVTRDRAVSELADVERQALANSAFGATPAARREAFGQVNAEVARWMEKHPERDPKGAFPVFLKTENRLTVDQMLAAVDLLGARRVLQLADQGVDHAQKAYDSLVSIRERALGSPR